MAAQFLDYYKIMGLDRNATDKEIKISYRKLARKWHPDLHPADEKKEAEEKFKKVNEAYEVLRDPEKRVKYDRLGSRWKDGADFNYQHRPGGEGIHFYTGEDAGGFSEFFKQFFGGGMGGFSGTRTRRAVRGQDTESEIALSLEEAYCGARKSLRVADSAVCGACGGNGAQGRSFCPQCGGTGSISREKTLEVIIPPGVSEGSRIRLKQQGGEGLAGAPRGDLYLKVRMRPHPHFRLKDSNVETDIVLRPEQAVLGDKITVPALDGELIVTVPPGSRSGTKLRVRGKGFPRKGGGRGDLYARIIIDIPPDLSAEQKGLYHRLSELGKGGG